MAHQRAPLQTGLERVLLDPDRWLGGKRLGLLTNPTGINRGFASTVDLLANLPEAQLIALFGPEHGVRGDLQAGELVADQIDLRTGLPVYSLYGDRKRPRPEVLSKLDAVVVDLQDVGCRFYTYVWTVGEILQACAETGTEVIILDRPNPIGGEHVQGPVLEPPFRSFVGGASIPIRHGLTLGELARWLNETEHYGARLTVVAVRHWDRGEAAFTPGGLPWVPPSPNMPTVDAALAYPGIGLLEGTTLSEGRGTTRPFEVFGAPWIEPVRFADRLNEVALPGTRFQPWWFRPSFSKHAGLACGGVLLHVTNRHRFDPVRTGLTVIAAALSLYPDDTGFLPGERRFFDLLVGNDWVRRGLETGVPIDNLITRWEPGLAAYRASRTALIDRVSASD